MVKAVMGSPGNKAIVGDPESPMIDKFEKLRKEESKLVKGIFQDNEVRGGSVKFCFRKFKGDPLKEYHLFDGQEYELPLAVVRHLNSGCAYHNHHFILDAHGQPTKSVKKTHRFSFKSAELL